MPDSLSLDPKRSAVLIMDYQSFIVGHYVSDPGALTGSAAIVLQRARIAGMRVIYVELKFRRGFPEGNQRHHRLAQLKAAVAAGILKEEHWHIHPALSPQEADVVVAKHRVSAFFGSDLDLILRSSGIETLVLFGLITGGVTLATLLDAFDADYRVIVLKDLCRDEDPAVHECLVEKIFPRYATVINSAEFLVEAPLQ